MIRRNGGFVSCSRCEKPVPGTLYNLDDPTTCPRCEAKLTVEVFPALYRQREIPIGEKLTADGEASCFFHPHKRAVLPCDDCGRFVCALCETGLGDRHLCPTCFQAGHDSGTEETLVSRRPLHDQTALSMALLPMLFWVVTIFTAPAALYLAIRHWRSPTSLLPRTRIRFVAAILIASLQLVGWTALAVTLIA